MQKFGLRTNRSARLNALELEIVREQASALGRAGRSLRLSLEAYNKALGGELSKEEEQTQVHDIADKLWALILQREFLGFTENNIEWIKDNYRVPEQAIASVGKQRLQDTGE